MDKETSLSIMIPEHVPVAKHSSSFSQSRKISTKHLHKRKKQNEKKKNGIKGQETNLRYLYGAVKFA